MNQVFCPGVLDGNLDDLLLVVNDVGNAVNDWYIQTFRSNELVKIILELEFDTWWSESVSFISDPSGNSGQLTSEFLIFIIKGSVFLSTNQDLFDLTSGDTWIVEGLNGGFESDNLVFKFILPKRSSSKPFFQVLDFLLKLDDLIFFFIEKASIVKDALSLFSGVVDSSLQQSIDLMFQKEEPSVVRFFFVSSDNDSWAGAEEILPEFKEGSLQTLKSIGVSISWDDDIFWGGGPVKVDWSLCGTIEAEAVDITAGGLKNLAVSASSNVGHI